MPAIAEPIAISSILLGVSLLLLFCVLASKASEWMGVPALLLFLLIGMLAGSDGPGGIWFDNAYVAQFMGTLALAYILFSGGVETEWRSVRPVLREASILATLGVLLTAVLVGAFAVYLLGFSWLEGFLLGSVISSTDAAAVFSILRARKISLKGKLRPLLELESGSNDPMAVFLTITFIELLRNPGTSWWHALPSFALQMPLGIGMGFLSGKAITYLVNRLRLEYEGLYPALTVALVLLVFGGTDLLGGNGFMAIYVAGLVFGNGHVLHRRSLTRFHAGMAWLMQIVMFVTLGLLVFPTHLVPVIGTGLLLSMFLMLIARPLSVFLCMIGSKFSWREKMLVSWVGLRGSVPIVLATFPLMAGVSQADMIFNMVFFVVIASVLLQGRLLPSVAKLLRLNDPFEKRNRPPLEFEQTEASIQTEMVEFVVPASSSVVGRRIQESGMPNGLLIAMICRDGGYLVPNGQTVLQAFDVLLVLGEKDTLKHFGQALGRREADHGGTSDCT